MPTQSQESEDRVAAATYPVHLGSAEAFSAVRALLQRGTFEEGAVSVRLGGNGRLAGYHRLCEGRRTLRGPIEDLNHALIRLFLDGEPVTRTTLDVHVPAHELEALFALGLVVGEERVEATVLLAPLRDLWLASDRIPKPTDTWTPAQDFVYSAVNELTGEFVAGIPNVPGAHVIELCAGSGVGALHALARGAAHATATDVTARSVHFARFNAMLNGFGDRFEAYQSDAWDGVGDRTFDVVLAHPPYVPAFVHLYDFRDAGSDGEQVSRRIVEGIAHHLRPGGRLFVRASLSDRKHRPIEQRLREWLGEASAECDLVVLERQEYSHFDYYRSINKKPGTFDDLELWMRHFASLEIERFVLVHLEVRRDATGRPPVTARRPLGPGLEPDVADWLMRWTRFEAAHGGAKGWLAKLGQARPRVPIGIQLNVHLSHQPDGWHTASGSVESMWPIRTTVKAPPLLPTLLELCDGTRTVAQLFAALGENGLIDADVRIADVSQLVETLAAAGMVEVAHCPLPSLPVAARPTPPVVPPAVLPSAPPAVPPVPGA